jgi:hypothetical protein
LKHQRLGLRVIDGARDFNASRGENAVLIGAPHPAPCLLSSRCRNAVPHEMFLGSENTILPT